MELCTHGTSINVTEFESAMILRTTGASIKKHHENNLAFQKDLSGIIYNLFKQENLLKINNTNVIFIDTVFKDLSKWIDTGEKQFCIFSNERLIAAEIPLNKPTKKNSFLIHGKFEDQRA